MQLVDVVEVRSNLHIVARERGKIVARRDVHNIFLDTGREWLSRLIAYESYAPEAYQRSDRVRYMGLGIGGSRQIIPAVANASPLGGPGDPYEANSAAGIGSNIQTDVSRSVTHLERPVRISGGSSHYPGISGDRWVGQIQAPVEHNTGTSATFRRVFTGAEVNYGGFASVPISEAMLFTSAADPEFYLNTGIAYDVFDSLSKTSAVSLEVEWSLDF
jgi:hypothetical protein